MSIMNGVAGARGHNPIGVVIHNDASGDSANAVFYRNWLPKHNPDKGFAHAYVCDDDIVIAEHEENVAWHCGNAWGNREFYSVEACQSMGDEQTFRRNEDKVLRFVAEKFKTWEIEPTRETVRLHRDFFPTACPHRSLELHGGVEGTRTYFIDKIKEYMCEEEEVRIVNASVQTNDGASHMRMTIRDLDDDCVQIVSKDGRLLTAAANKANANVDFRDFDCGDFQKWKILNKTYKHAHYMMFECVGAPGLYLSVEANGVGKSNLKLYTDLHNMKQKFYIREESDGTSMIIHAFSHLCVSEK